MRGVSSPTYSTRGTSRCAGRGVKSSRCTPLSTSRTRAGPSTPRSACSPAVHTATTREAGRRQARSRPRRHRPCSQVPMLPPCACTTTCAPPSRAARPRAAARTTVTVGASADWMCTTSARRAARPTATASATVRRTLPHEALPPSGVPWWATFRNVTSCCSASGLRSSVSMNVGMPPRSGGPLPTTTTRSLAPLPTAVRSSTSIHPPRTDKPPQSSGLLRPPGP